MNGIEMITHVSAMEAMLPSVSWGSNRIRSWAEKQTAIATLNSSEAVQRRRRMSTGRNRLGNRWTVSAPAVKPNSDTEMATNAKWYHMVTLKIRVNAISYIRVASVVRNSPA